MNDSPHDDPVAAVAPHVADELPVLGRGHTYASVTDHISAIVLTRKTSRGWIFGFAVSFTLMMAFLYATGYLFARGVGIWGTTIPVGWAFPIVNFVWWIGIGHAGTLISAVLLLAHQEWRTSTTRCSTCPLSAWPAAIGSFCASRPAIRCSTATRRGGFSNG